MTKRIKIIYWISTIWLALGMLSSGVVQLLKMSEEVDFIIRLGYPVYFLTILVIWKILGVVALLIPKIPLLRNGLMQAFSLPCREQCFHILRPVASLRN